MRDVEDVGGQVRGGVLGFFQRKPTLLQRQTPLASAEQIREKSQAFADRQAKRHAKMQMLRDKASEKVKEAQARADAAMVKLQARQLRRQAFSMGPLGRLSEKFNRLFRRDANAAPRADRMLTGPLGQQRVAQVRVNGAMPMEEVPPQPLHEEKQEAEEIEDILVGRRKK